MFVNSKILSVRKVESITMPTFTKLLVIRMVAKSFSGFSKRLITLNPFPSLSSNSSFLFEGDSEKKATSEPEINAELINNITTMNKPIRLSESRL